jgi:hypothetical protein
MKLTKIQKIIPFNYEGQCFGYKIKMSDSSKNIICRIDNTQQCCETFGVYVETDLSVSSSLFSEISKNQLDDFIGSEYHSVDIGNVTSSQENYDDMLKITMFINTNKGKISIQFYNEHNGYYTHNVFIQTENGKQNISL